MYAIVDIAGFQEKVEKGMKLKVPLLKGDTGASVTFEKVLLIADGDAITLGTPFVEGATIGAKILSVGKGEKVRVQKAHRRKRYRRVYGHRQDFTEIEVTVITTK
ncbi:MAG: 50S ribosomal protein L21 [Candidatus Peribacteraceae bacterium]|jgi:large subunit ribosomal protein L21